MLEQATLYNTLNFSLSFSSGANATALSGKALDVYQCPSSTMIPYPTATGNGSGTYNNANQLQAHHYVGVAGGYLAGWTPADAQITTSYGVITDNGLLAPFRVRRMRDCTDGTSTTLIVAEQSGLIGTQRYDIRSSYYGGWCGGSSHAGPLSTMPAGHWANSLSTLRYRINSTTVTTGSNVTYGANTLWTSFHAGGIHGLLGDGSVRFVNDNADMQTLLRVAVMNDSEPVSEF